MFVLDYSEKFCFFISIHFNHIFPTICILAILFSPKISFMKTMTKLGILSAPNRSTSQIWPFPKKPLRTYLFWPRISNRMEICWLSHWLHWIVFLCVYILRRNKQNFHQKKKKKWWKFQLKILFMITTYLAVLSMEDCATPLFSGIFEVFLSWLKLCWEFFENFHIFLKLRDTFSKVITI